MEFTILCWYTYISNHRISWKVKVYFWVEIKSNVYILLNIQNNHNGRLCKNFCQSPHLVQICGTRNNFLHETNNILLLYIKKICHSMHWCKCYKHTCICTYIHTYTYIYTSIHTYTYTCTLVQANFLSRHYIYNYDMVTTKGLLT